MTDLFRAFLAGVSARGGYCLDCLSEIYGEPSTTVTGYLSEMGISGRQATCANGNEDRETFRSPPIRLLIREKLQDGRLPHDSARKRGEVLATVRHATPAGRSSGRTR